MSESWARKDISPSTPASWPPVLAKSSITYIDGDQGVLLHRGYPIAQLATQASYLEVCYILLYGEAPPRPICGI